VSIKNINDFKSYKDSKTPISVITCYDYSTAKIINETGIDAILVGDSLGMVFQGHNSTIPVTLDNMIYHAQAVRRGSPSKFIITDLPFMSYHVSIEQALHSCGRVLKETGTNSVKLEGGRDFAETVKALVKASIPVMGHIGLTPQSIHKIGGYTVQGRDEEKRIAMIEDAIALEDAGAFSIVLEMVPETLAKEISEKISIPTIGIGGGRYCNGQVLVVNDMLGMDDGFKPKFLKKYASLASIMKNAIEQYDSEVKSGSFPEEKNCY
jgi:3-methyl-2-oxobutanoate hydroxymethyltransferase